MRSDAILAPLLPLLWMIVVTPPATAECDRFVARVSDSVVDYQRNHRIDPENQEMRALTRRFLPRLWVDPESAHPVDFGEYLALATLRSQADGHVLARPPVAKRLSRLSRDEQCASYLEAPELRSADPAPVHVQAFADDGPDGSADWIYLKYTYVFDWSGLARERSFVVRLGALLTGGDADHWHRLDVHTAAILGLDSTRRLRTVTLQQHNDKRTYVAGVDFERRDRVHVAAARRTNELYLDTGSTDLQRRRAVPSFLQWPHLIRERESTIFGQVDEFVGRNAGAEEVDTRPVFAALDDPLASFAGLLAPRRRLLGFYIGRDGPPGYDFTGIPEMPRAVVMGYWEERDDAFLEILDEHLKGFQTTEWEPITDYLVGRLSEALRRSADRDRELDPS